MRKIDKPTVLQEDVCNSFGELKYRDRVLEKAKHYDREYLNSADLLKDENIFISTDPDYKDYMKRTYSSKFSHKYYMGSYLYYKKIRDSEKKCPYCNFITRTVTHLDHYLPKSIFPVHAITVNNLVPICRDCNTVKDNYYPTSQSKALLHPYYDTVIDELYDFLKCQIIEEANIGFRFYIKKLSHWNDMVFNRVKQHFELLKIDDLYRTDFEADFVSYFEEIKWVYEETGDIEEIRIILKRKVDALYKVKIKPWAYVGFKSILDSDWFLEIYLPSKANR